MQGGEPMDLSYITLSGIYQNAAIAYLNGRSREAAILYEQARTMEKQHGRMVRAFDATVQAADSWRQTDEYVRALGLLIESLREVPPGVDSGSLYWARNRAFIISLRGDPRIERLYTLLDEIDKMPLGDPSLPQGDLQYLKGLLLTKQGRWEKSIEQMELGWAKYDGSGILQHNLPFYNVTSCLRMEQRLKAEVFCSLLHDTDQRVPLSRVRWNWARCMLALWDGDITQIKLRAKDLENASAGMQDLWIRANNTEVQVRSLLLDQSLDDPENKFHPARTRIREFRFKRQDIDAVYQWRLLKADYRLASVRYAAGMLPVVDMWYRKPHNLSSCGLKVSRDAFVKRIQRARQTYASAMHQAQFLDQRFACDWRRQEVLSHQDRLKEICEHCV
jgi:hypothetical protein